MTKNYLFLRFEIVWAQLCELKILFSVFGGMLAFFAASDVFAGTVESTGDAAASDFAERGNTAFNDFYAFVHGAATGTLGKGIALTGGIIGLGFGAASGKALPAIVGVVLAMFGALGPKIIEALFSSALI